MLVSPKQDLGTPSAIYSARKHDEVYKKMLEARFDLVMVNASSLEDCVLKPLKLIIEQVPAGLDLNHFLPLLKVS